MFDLLRGNSDEMHVFGLGDSHNHISSIDCSCNPEKAVRFGFSLIIHNVVDKMEGLSDSEKRYRMIKKAHENKELNRGDIVDMLKKGEEDECYEVCDSLFKVLK